MKFREENLNTIRKIEEADPETYGKIVSLFGGWMSKRVVSNLKTIDRLNTYWTRIGSKVNGLRKTDPRVANSILEAFKRRKKEIMEAEKAAEEQQTGEASSSTEKWEQRI
jgi:alkylated DNA nucleotide flippase Atl1